ncbi:MAG: serine/threonine-protein kinase, partial [Labilithrix sp.]
MLNQAADPFGIIGQVLDSQFRVDRLVGEGGFSAVYRGHHLGLDEPIAIKCLKLPPSLARPLVDQFVKRFRDESRILYRLSQGNLNIVRSIAGGTWQSPVGILVPFMILEWMEGRSLANEFTIRRTVGKQGRSLDEVLKVFESAADGISYAHSQGVIHRDLNPGNFFFTNSPQGQRLKVLDFGVAKILDDSTLDIERTQTVGQIRIFAPAYGSPEQFDDSLGKVGAPSDVYAFALILLEALRDRAVNDGTHLGEFAQRAIDPANRPTPRSLGIDVPDEVESIFARATRLRPHERWQTASEFWNALTHAASAAVQERYAQAATETPSLGMPQSASRSTKTGMAPPAQHQGKAPMKRMDKTVPVGAVLPPVPGQAPRPPIPPSAPRVESAPVAPISPPDDDGGLVHEEETRIGQAVAGVPDLSEHDGEEVTRVGAPAADVLAGLADAELRPGQRPVTMTKVSQGNQNQPPPRPAAGQGPDQHPSNPGFPAAPSPPQGRPPNNMAGTLMMNPGAGGFGPLPPPPQQQPQPPQQRPMQVQPQMPTTPGIGPGGPPPQQGYPQAPQIQMPPQQQQQMPPQMMQQPPPQQQMPPQGYPQQQHQQQQQPQPQMPPPQYGGPVDASLAPDGVPKKSSAMLFIGIGVGIVVLIGVAILVVVVASGPKTPQVASASVSALAPPPPAPAPAPEPETTVATPTPTPEPEADAGTAAAAETDAGGAVAANTNPPDNGNGQP